MFLPSCPQCQCQCTNTLLFLFVSLYFPFRHVHKLQAIISECVNAGIGDTIAKDLMGLITDPDKSAYIFIELLAVVEFLGPLCDISYQHEGNSNEVFSIAEACEDVLEVLTFPEDDGAINASPRLAAEITKQLEISWGGKSFEELALALAEHQDLQLKGPNYSSALRQLVDSQYSDRRLSAHRSARDVRAVQPPTFELMDRAGKAAYKRRVEACDREKASIKIQHEKRLAELLAVQEAALAKAPPQSVEAWMEHLRDGLGLTAEYITSRFSAGGT